MFSVAVIGAGVSGLITARELCREGHRVVVFEKASRLGGTWVYDPQVESDQLGLDPSRETVHTSLYLSLRTNLPRQLMSFTDFPFERKDYGDPRLFPRHDEVLRYLEDFAAEFGLVDLIRFNAEVVRVETVDLVDVKFVVEWTTSGSSSEEVFDAVVVCNGHYSVPQVATNIPGIDKWARNQLHSHNYREPEPFRDQVVVMIGSGPSTWDISREMATVAKEVHLTSRSPDVEVSKMVECDNIWQHKKIDHVSEDGTVAFEDGFSVKADTIFHSTGYKYRCSFLKTNGIVTIEDGRVGPLYKHVFSPRFGSRLSFVGLPYWTIVFLMLELQSKWIAQVLSAKVSLPSEEDMLAEVQERYRQMEEKGIPDHHTHSLNHQVVTNYQLDYLDWLAAQVGTLVEDRAKETMTYLINRLVTGSDGIRGSVLYRDAVDIINFLSCKYV